MEKIYEDAYNQLLENNKTWVAEKLAEDSEFFKRHAEGQTPTYLWIGCSDSRVHPGELTKTEKGEIFVHRNVANMVVHTDLNVMSVLQYAVEVLKVKHIIVCGHYKCGGVLTAMGKKDMGLVNKWLRNIKEVYSKHKIELALLGNAEEKANRLVELNVIEQVHNLAKTSFVQKAIRDNKIMVHAWVYDIHTGLIKDLNQGHDEISDLDEIFQYED